MSHTPVFDALAAEYPGIHRASNIFPQPAPEPHISFIKERGHWLEEAFAQVYRVTLGPKASDSKVVRVR